MTAKAAAQELRKPGRVWLSGRVDGKVAILDAWPGWEERPETLVAMVMMVLFRMGEMFKAATLSDPKNATTAFVLMSMAAKLDDSGGGKIPLAVGSGMGDALSRAVGRSRSFVAVCHGNPANPANPEIASVIGGMRGDKMLAFAGLLMMAASAIFVEERPTLPAAGGVAELSMSMLPRIQLAEMKMAKQAIGGAVLSAIKKAESLAKATEGMKPPEGEAGKN